MNSSVPANGTRAQKVISEIKKTLTRKYPMISEIRLFGSYARGTNNSRSDIDILILTPDVLTDRYLRGEIRDAIACIADKQRLDTDVVFYSFPTYQTDDSRFTRELRQSKLIYKKEDVRG